MEKQTSKEFKEEVIDVGNGFYNFRGKFLYKGFIDIGLQMSVIKLKSGDFMVVDGIELVPGVKARLDHLTDNGDRIKYVVFTHPFHIVHVPALYKAYPNAEYYGTPRHTRKFPSVNWAGDLSDCKVRAKWEPEVQVRIPGGMEFVHPLPEKTNHMCGAFVFHEPSHTIHENDTIMVGYKPNLLMRMAGYKHGAMKWHQCITGPGLIPSPEAPFILKDWILEIIRDWDFDNLVAGHFGVVLGGARGEMQRLVVKSEKLFLRLQKKYKKQGAISFVANGKYNLNLEEEIFNGDTACECG